MGNGSSIGPSTIEEMVGWIKAVFAELVVGLVIFHMEDLDDPNSLRLVYANKAASDYTDADLTKLVGKRIIDAFPGLEGTYIPPVYADVVRTKRSSELGSFEYAGDPNVATGYYAVKAFPIPHDCVGVVFENITVRKQVEELVKKQREKEDNNR